ncbi:hypothetical protein WHR41_00131 [Cladosporium halotolerans]|uniref:Uncharacterized protein n=1 Tax=Cladosporium halotolerans TaxID=1052096 RepID=A0AB34L1G1_9PEZI
MASTAAESSKGKRPLLPPKAGASSSYTESKVHRSNTLDFEIRNLKEKAQKPIAFDSSKVPSPLLDPKLLERLVISSKTDGR